MLRMNETVMQFNMYEMKKKYNFATAYYTSCVVKLFYCPPFIQIPETGSQHKVAT